MVDTATNTREPSPLLETKLYIPKWRSGLLSRTRLVERLNRGTERKLTLVSAPAGFGKTTLLAEWLAAPAASERPAAWVSLDRSDNDPTHFWDYFITALQSVESGVGENALSLLHSPQPPPIEALLTTLMNEINAISDGFTLVLDDYHVIDSSAVNGAVAFLIDHLPPQMHLVIASRADPPLPLARLRVRGELTELRAADLRCTTEEASAFLNQAMGLDLQADDVAALEDRTEGWIAGLQLAALSMQGREDVPGFIRAFAGDDRYIADFLVEEVLQRQPDQVRSFLLHTSILDRLSGPLCEAVTGQEDGKEMLEALERGNLFVVPLDDKRQWYRYHHLFADVLHAHSMDEQPHQVPILHGRASEWYEQNGLPADAIRHAIAAEDFERAAALMEPVGRAMLLGHQSATLIEWLKALPDEIVRARPVLSGIYAWVLINVGQMDVIEPRLRDAGQWLETTSDTSEEQEPPLVEMVVVDEEEFRSLPGMIAAARAARAGAVGDVPGTAKYARQALDLLLEEDHLMRGVATAILGLAYLTSGDLDAVHRTVGDGGDGLANLWMAGDTQRNTSGAYILADIRMAQGRMHEAVATYQQSMQLAMEQGEPAPRGTADLYAGLSELRREQ